MFAFTFRNPSPRAYHEATLDSFHVDTASGRDIHCFQTHYKLI